MQPRRSSYSRQLWGEQKKVKQHSLSLSASGLNQSGFSAQDVKSICWSADDECRSSPGAGKHSDEAFPKIPQHSATIKSYRGNQIGWDRYESDSEGLTWQVKGMNGDASSTELCVESHSHTLEMR